MSNQEIEDFFYGYGWKPFFVTGSDPLKMHEEMAKTMDMVYKEILAVRKKGSGYYPVIILTTPKGWMGPKEYNNLKIEGSFRSHQVPIPVSEDNLVLIEKWLKSYKIDNLFDESGKLVKRLKDLCPPINNCMGNSFYTNGGIKKDLIVPNFLDYCIDVDYPGSVVNQDTMELGKYIRDLFVLNKQHKNFRMFGPDEALSNRFNYVFEKENRTWEGKILKNDEFLDNSGRVMDSYLSEHLCEGMLEGYLLTGRHGFIHSYEAFVRIVDSMASQHAKWLKVCNQIEWRRPIASLNF